jgi:chromate reductase, NAD(P)H dehydrogenase (quinone)
MIKILAISGSLRASSSNTALLQATIALSPEAVEMRLYERLNDLPHFNPDLEPIEPESVIDLRSQIAWADGLLICSPEYAHGVPGVLKNALDWLVSGSEFVEKPIALFNASPRATHAQASLIEIITTMSGRVISEACLDVPLLGRKMDAVAISEDPEISEAVQGAIDRFVRAITGAP